MVNTKDAQAKVKAVGESDGLEQGQFEALVSVFDTVDSAGDVVKSGAFTDTLDTWHAKGDRIPVVWAHDWTNPFSHIGSVVEAKETDEGLWVRGELDLDNPTAEQVHRLLRGRRVTQFSYAFDVEDAEMVTKDNEDVCELRSLRVHEIGPCLVGANQDTELLASKAQHVARNAKADGELTDRDVSRLREAHAALGDVLDAVTNGDDDEGAGDDGDGGGEDSKASAADGIKGPVGSHSTDTSEDAWDGPANKARLSNDAGEDTYRKAFAWLDPDGDPDTKEAWSMLHHFVAEDGAVGAASTKACTTAIGVLNGGRGESNIPDSDREGVHAHLAKHLRDADMDVPDLKATPTPDGDGGSQSRADDAAGATQEAGQPDAAAANDPARTSGSSAAQPQQSRSAEAAARLTLLTMRGADDGSA